jgi:hypothetical protein
MPKFVEPDTIDPLDPFYFPNFDAVFRELHEKVWEYRLRYKSILDQPDELVYAYERLSTRQEFLGYLHALLHENHKESLTPGKQHQYKLLDDLYQDIDEFNVYPQAALIAWLHPNPNYRLDKPVGRYLHRLDNNIPPDVNEKVKYQALRTYLYTSLMAASHFFLRHRERGEILQVICKSPTNSYQTITDMDEDIVLSLAKLLKGTPLSEIRSLVNSNSYTTIQPFHY